MTPRRSARIRAKLAPRHHNHLLPVEIIEEIIRFVMAGEIGDLDSRKAPLMYRRLSRLWKNVVDNMPEVWSQLMVLDTQFRHGADKAIELWLGRARNRDLEVTLHAPLIFNPNLLERMLRAVAVRSDKLQVLTLRSVPHRFLPTLLSNPRAPLTSLRTLKLSVLGQPTFTIDPSATALQHVYLDLSLSPAIPRADIWNLSWPQLTHLYLFTFTGMLECVWDLFRTCINLDTLSIWAPRNMAIPYIPYHPLNPLQSNVRHLSLLVHTRSGVVGFFLDALKLPFLEELQIIFLDIPYDRNVWPKEEIIALRERSVAPLRSVVIDGKVMRHEDLVDFVTRMPTIEELKAVDQTTRTDYVTPAVLALLPQTEAAIQQRRMVYRDELDAARQDGRRT